MIDQLSAAALDLLASDAVATVATLNRDGSRGYPALANGRRDGGAIITASTAGSP